MTSSTVSSAAERVPAQVRLGPSAAGRCRRRIHLDAAAPGRRAVLSTAARRALDDLAEHRELVSEALLAAHPDSVSGRDGAAGQAWRTRPTPVVLAPEMATTTRSGAADLLLWTGDGYVPVIIRAHRTRDRGVGAPISLLTRLLPVQADPTHRARRNRADRLALAHHYRQLQTLGCASRTARGGVIGRGSPTDGAGRPDQIGGEDDSSVIVWHDLDTGAGSALADYDDRFSDRLAVAAAAVAGTEPLAFPSRVAECRRCPWWPECGPQLRSTGDISLLLAGADVAVARAAGVETIPDLAELDRDAAAALPLTVAHVEQAQIRARAWRQGAVLVRIGPRAAIRRADVEIDVDAESYGEDGAYLWGAQLSGADVELQQGYRSFVTWQRLPSPSQAEVFGEFFGYLLQVRAAAEERGLSFAVFCYAKAAEERWMLGLARRYAGLPGVPDARAVAAFCASPQWVDLLSEIKRQFVSTGSLRLKELAAAMGFAWRDPEPGGENSMAWYRAAVDGQPVPAVEPLPGRSPAHPLGSAHPMAQRVVRYNEDDVLATLAVRRWITEHLAELPTVDDLASAQRGAIRSDPSSRMTSPLR